MKTAIGLNLFLLIEIVGTNIRSTNTLLEPQLIGENGPQVNAPPQPSNLDFEN